MNTITPQDKKALKLYAVLVVFVLLFIYSINANINFDFRNSLNQKAEVASFEGGHFDAVEQGGEPGFLSQVVDFFGIVPGGNDYGEVIDMNNLPSHILPVPNNTNQPNDNESSGQGVPGGDVAITNDNSGYSEGKNQCKRDATGEKLFVLFGEKISKDSSYTKKGLSDIWSTIDGENWKREITSTNVGERWLPALVNVKDTVYIFGGMSDKQKNHFDSSVYKTNDMINFEHVGNFPSTDVGQVRRTVVIYFKNQFWLLDGSGVEGIWSSSDGANWTQEIKEAPWKNHFNYIYLRSATVLNDTILFTSSSAGSGWIPSVLASTDGKKWDYYSPHAWKLDGWQSVYSPIVFKNKVWSFSRHNSDAKGAQITAGESYRIWSMPLVSGIKPSSNKWTASVLKDNDPFAIEKHHSEETAEILIPFKNKLYSIGGAIHGSESGEKWISGGDAKKTTGNIFVSNDAINWSKVNQNGVVYPGPADRSMAVATTRTQYTSANAPDLEVTSIRKINQFISNGNSKNVTLGEWKLSAKAKENNTDYNGTIIINSLNLDGTLIPPTSSSLENLKNIRVYANGTLVANIPTFTPPFYSDPCAPGSNCGYINQKKVDFYINKFVKINLRLKQGESMNIKIVGDLNNVNADFTTYIYKFNFNSTSGGYPCSIYTTDGNSAIKFPGYLLQLRNKPTSPTSKIKLSF